MNEAPGSGSDRTVSSAAHRLAVARAGRALGNSESDSGVPAALPQ